MEHLLGELGGRTGRHDYSSVFSQATLEAFDAQTHLAVPPTRAKKQEQKLTNWMKREPHFYISQKCGPQLVLQLRFGSCGKNGCFGFDFSKLFRTDEAYAATRHVRSENPSDLFHLLLTCQSLVFVERAFPHREPNLTLDKEESAKHFFLRGAKSLDDVPVATRPAQGFASLRRSSFHFDADHGFSFSKKRTALRLRPVVMAEICASTMSIGAREMQNTENVEMI